MPNLIEFHIARLSDKNPEVRQRAAQELALLGDVQALPALEDAYRKESDPQAKRVIQEAGRKLYEQQQAGAGDG